MFANKAGVTLLAARRCKVELLKSKVEKKSFNMKPYNLRAIYK